MTNILLLFFTTVGNDDEIDAKWVELTKPKNRKLDKLKFDKKAELPDEKYRQGRKRNSSKVSAKEDDKRSHKLETPVKKVVSMQIFYNLSNILSILIIKAKIGFTQIFYLCSKNSC